MTAEPITVAVWGFEREDLALWRDEGFAPERLEERATWPDDRPIVVNGWRAAAYQQEAKRHLRADGRLPDAILYQPRGEVAPAPLRASFDLIVPAGEWGQLRRQLRAPQRFTAAALAEAVSPAFLDTLDRPVAALTIDADFIEAAFGAGAAGELLDEARRLLARRENQPGFRAALEARLRVQRRVVGPSTAQVESMRRDLAALRHRRGTEAGGDATPRTVPAPAAPFERARFEQPKDEVTPRVAPTSAPPDAARLVVARFDGPQPQVAAREISRWLIANLRQLARDLWSVQDMTSGRQPAATRQGAPPGPQEAGAGEAESTTREMHALAQSRVRRLSIASDEAGADLVLADLRGNPINRRLPQFRVEIQVGESIVWGGESDVDGRARVPGHELAEAARISTETGQQLALQVLVGAAPRLPGE